MNLNKGNSKIHREGVSGNTLSTTVYGTADSVPSLEEIFLQG